MFWKIVGVFLLAWAGIDLYNGYTMIYETVTREGNPTMYWSAITCWIALGISCFFSWE
ncbi:hypothetical protein [Bacterioplanoides sp.]|uniref:hypothetical protein n=1 Tax=Bacterioplanoides sp. TaxID=2066072 RepID=UPI003B5B5D92